MRSALMAFLAAIFPVLLALNGCSPDASAPRTPNGKPLVVATTGMVADLARNIASDRAAVLGLMGEGVDPHLYKPTRSDIERLLAADIILYNGLLLEGKMSDALVRAASSGRAVIAVTERIDPSTLLEPAEFAGQYDPHVWMDPRAWVAAVEPVREVLTTRDPGSAAIYSANADHMRADIAALDQWAERVLATVPPERRVLVTAHDAFNYFGRRYGYEVVGIQGLSTESEAGVRDIERIVDLLVTRKIPAVFVESTVSERNIRALVDGARARGHAVAIGGQLYSDAMGPPGTYEGTYVGMIDHNITTIVRALGGDAPERGMQGRLTR